MPNGNREFDRTALDAWFAPYRAEIENFAKMHALHIVKYYHDIPSWSLSKPNPKGGTAKIDVVRSDHDDILVGAIWFLDDEQSETRWLYRPQPIRLPKDTKKLTVHLARELKALLDTPLGAWTMKSSLAI